jgi:hypothetical protein
LPCVTKEFLRLVCFNLLLPEERTRGQVETLAHAMVIVLA